MINHQKIKVAVLAGGPSNESEVSLATAQNIINNLDKKLYEIKQVIIDKQKRWKVGSYVRTPRAALANMDVIINALHGQYGEDGQVQALLNRLGVDYTGSGPIASALAMDKLASRYLFKQVGLSVPRTLSFEFNKILDFKAVQNAITGFFNLPVVIKPNNQGSSIGVNIVKNKSDLGRTLIAVAKLDKTIL